MADNPFAKFNQQAAPAAPATKVNPFAQFNAPANEGIPQGRNYAAYDVPFEAIKNLPSSAVKFGEGIIEAASSPVETAETLARTAVGGAFNVLPKGAQDYWKGISTDPASLQRSIDIADAVGGEYKKRYGSWESVKRTFAEDPVGALLDLSAVAGGGGAVLNTTGKVAKLPSLGKAADVANKISAYTNPVTPVVKGAQLPFRATGKASDYTNKLIDPKGAAYLDAAEGRGTEIVNALRSPNLEIVPGSMPTAAQAASSTGATKFVALGENLTKSLTPTEAASVLRSQEKARSGAIREIGKTPDELGVARGTRAADAEINYDIARQSMVKADPALARIVSNPYVKDAMPDALKLSQASGFTFAEQPIAVLHNLKLSLDKLIEKTGDGALGRAEKAQVVTAKNQLVGWMEKKEPSYKTAREQFAKQSEGINQMEIGQYLEGKLVPIVGEGAAKQSASSFMNAIKEAPATITKMGTSTPRYEQISKALTKDQMKVVESVRKDLSRAAETERLAGEGSIAAKQIADFASEVASMPNLLSRIATVSNVILRRLSGKINRKLAIEMATEMLDPTLAAKALENAVAKDASRAFKRKPFITTGKIAEDIARSPVTTGTLSINQLAPASQNQLAR
tara:strand:+ start:1780 stop:3657 length:1878 start_codon:yes stop_codon:yes gene_type:complete